MNFELVTNIIILLTALVGLYKAATFKWSPKGDGQDQSHSSSSIGVFSELFELGGVFLFMLAFPAFIWVFSFIVQNMPGTSSSDSIPELKIEITKESSKTELALAAAIGISSKYDRDDELKKIVKFATNNNEITVALKAASALSSKYDRDETFKIVINKLMIAEKPNKANAADAESRAAD